MSWLQEGQREGAQFLQKGLCSPANMYAKQQVTTHLHLALFHGLVAVDMFYKCNAKLKSSCGVVNEGV